MYGDANSSYNSVHVCMFIILICDIAVFCYECRRLMRTN